VRVAVVLGAGGLPGEAFHHGVLRALRESAGYDARSADLVIGTSAGSIVAATLRAPKAPPPGDPAQDAPPPIRIGSAHRPALRQLARSAVTPWRLRPASFPLSLLPAGGRSPEAICEGVRFRHGHGWPAEPTWIVGVRRSDGRRVVFGRGGAPATDIGTAVAASCAVPLVFSPVVIGRHEYVDGGVHSPTNADLAARSGCDLLIVSAPMSVAAGERPPARGVPRLWWRRALRREVAVAERQGIAVRVFEPDAALVGALGLHPLRTHRLEEISELAYQRAAAELAARPLLDLGTGDAA
jgi:NTE family protein